MTGFAKAGRILALASLFASGLSLACHQAEARPQHATRLTGVTSGQARHGGHNSVQARGNHAPARIYASFHRERGAHGRHFAWRRGLPVLQCVTFARADTGIQLSGNAANWWANAENVYARGNTPEPGSVLAFRASGRIRLGHVAVVSSVINDRLVEIDQSHWAGRGISRNIPVIDVSPANDWTQVRVGLGQTGDFGAIYPTHGFIYPRAAGGLEVAEAPKSARGVDLSNAAFSAFNPGAPDRSIR